MAYGHRLGDERPGRPSRSPPPKGSPRRGRQRPPATAFRARPVPRPIAVLRARSPPPDRSVAVMDGGGLVMRPKPLLMAAGVLAVIGLPVAIWAVSWQQNDFDARLLLLSVYAPVALASLVRARM